MHRHEATLVEAAFERKGQQQPEVSLMSHVNHVGQKKHLVGHETLADVPEAATASATEAAAAHSPKATSSDQEKTHGHGHRNGLGQMGTRKRTILTANCPMTRTVGLACL